MSATVLRGDARSLPLADASVDLIVTSPPYWSLRSYTDGGEHYGGQIGAEPTPAEYIDNLIACTREWMRVLKPSGSIWANLGDKYSGAQAQNFGGVSRAGASSETWRLTNPKNTGIPAKSLIGLPWRYALRCIDDLGLILRAEVIWSKPNGLPESVTDRVRRSHEQWFHLVKSPRYFSAVDTVREEYSATPAAVTARRISGDPRTSHGGGDYSAQSGRKDGPRHVSGGFAGPASPLGKLPGSVWTIPAEPLKVPESLGVDHFACVDAGTEILTRRGWLRHDDVKIGDEVAGYDLDSGLTTWTRSHGVHRYTYDGELVAVEARGLSMRLTPNHRTLVHDHRGRHRFRGAVQVIDASALEKRHAVPRAVQWAEDGREKSIGVDLAALLGWVAAEGWYSKDRRRVYLSQSETVNPAKVGQIAALLERLGDEPLRTSRDRNWRGKTWRDAQWRLGPAVGAEVLGIMPDKMLPAWLVDLPLAEARALLDAFVDGDGNRRADGRISAFQKIRRNLDVLQAIAVRLGFNTTLKRDEANNRWVLYLNPPRPARLRRADGTSLVGRERYKGVVWCVTTGTGTFVARRNGTVFVTGNSFPTEWPRRIIQGWSPSGICTACGEGRRPVSAVEPAENKAWARAQSAGRAWRTGASDLTRTLGAPAAERARRITGEACACPDTGAPTRPSVVLDPFGGTGTTALVAHALGRLGISVDMSADYCRLARWRTTDPGELARAMRVEKPPKEHHGQLDLLADISGNEQRRSA